MFNFYLIYCFVEFFDRGMYVGLVGWFGGMGLEFVVGIWFLFIEFKLNYINNGVNIVYKVIMILVMLSV